jgi:hypothetical protein
LFADMKHILFRNRNECLLFRIEEVGIMYKVSITIYSNICSLPKIGKPNQTPLRY